MPNQYSNKYTKEFINEVLEFYKNNSNTITCEIFHIKLKKLREILKLHNVNEHTYIQNYRLTKYYRHGDETYVNSEKAKETCLKKYGSLNPIGNKEIQEKCKSTRLKKYGDENYNNQEKSKKSKLERYGNENYNNSSKMKQTKLERYGDPWYRNTDKAKKTCIDKYGVDNYAKTHEFSMISRKLYTYDNINFDSLPELALYIYAKDHNEEIIKNPCRFEYEYLGKIHYYFPDFLYKGEYIEIKGDHFFKDDGTMCNPFDHSQDEFYESKHLCGINNGVKFWKYDDYKFALKYIDTIKERLNLNGI